MARVTVEDCLKRVANRFDLVLQAAKRAHEIELGGTPMVPPENDKPAVIALREIAAGVDVTQVRQQEEEITDEEIATSQEAVSTAATPVITKEEDRP